MVRFKFLSKVTSGTIRLAGRVSTLITFLLILLITAVYFADNWFADGYYSAYLIRSWMSAENNLFFEFSYFSEAHPVLSFISSVGFFAAIIGIKALLRAFFMKKVRKHSVSSNIASLSLNVLLNLTMIAAAVTLVLNGMIVTYVRSFTYDGDMPFREQRDFVAEQIRKDDVLTSVALQKIIFDTDKDPGYVSALSFDERVKLCEEVNRLIDRSGGPRSAEEHYLRNRLNYAPQSLEAMLAEIKDPEGVSWILLPPDQSSYHMFGPNGEYNLKFVSQDGAFEAVYNLNGELLTERNDPINMGTYNYADPVTEPQKHSTYDVLPYYEWGNTADSKAYQSDDVTAVFETLERFNDNPEAMERYEYYSELVNTAE